MKDFMMRFASKEAFGAFPVPPNSAVDEIGAIGEDVRWHVNLRLLDPDPQTVAQLEALPEWVDPDTVATPERVWLGGMAF